jgi:hypothetical protein
MIHNHINRNDKNIDLMDKKLNLLFKDTKQYFDNLNKTEDIKSHAYIIQSNKGNITTLIPKIMYEDEVTKLLNDKENFRIHRQDPTQKIQNELTHILDKLIHKKCMTTEEKNQYFDNTTKLTMGFLQDLIQFWYTNNYGQFRNICYKQIEGLPICRPLPPAAADLVMTDLITTCKNKLNFNLPLILLLF